MRLVKFILPLCSMLVMFGTLTAADRIEPVPPPEGVSGVDEDGNGLRDDVDRFVEQRVADIQDETERAQAREALTQLGKVMHDKIVRYQELTGDAEPTATTVVNLPASDRAEFLAAGERAAWALRSNNLDVEEEIRLMRFAVINTPQRYLAYRSIDLALSGAFRQLQDDGNQCDPTNPYKKRSYVIYTGGLRDSVIEGQAALVEIAAAWCDLQLERRSEACVAYGFDAAGAFRCEREEPVSESRCFVYVHNPSESLVGDVVEASTALSVEQYGAALERLALSDAGGCFVLGANGGCIQTVGERSTELVTLMAELPSTPVAELKRHAREELDNGGRVMFVGHSHGSVAGHATYEALRLENDGFYAPALGAMLIAPPPPEGRGCLIDPNCFYFTNESDKVIGFVDTATGGPELRLRIRALFLKRALSNSPVAGSAPGSARRSPATRTAGSDDTPLLGENGDPPTDDVDALDHGLLSSYWAEGLVGRQALDGRFIELFGNSGVVRYPVPTFEVTTLTHTVTYSAVSASRSVGPLMVASSVEPYADGVLTAKLTAAMTIRSTPESLFSVEPSVSVTNSEVVIEGGVVQLGASGQWTAEVSLEEHNAAAGTVTAVVGQVAVKVNLPLPEMVEVSTGSFVMGESRESVGADDERPTRTVTINGFKVSKHEVTRDQYAAFAAARPDSAGTEWENLGSDFPREGNHPVVNVSWNEAKAYVAWLNEVTEEKGYRLLSEAEWEYVARAGTTMRYSFGDDASSPTLSLHANCRNTVCDDGYDFTAPVGSFLANPWGVHDMHGNAWEWVEDCEHENYDDAPTDGSAWGVENDGNCDRAVLRGGSWGNDAGDLRAAVRYDEAPHLFRNLSVGFRVAQGGGPEASLPQMVEVPSGSFVMGDLAGVGASDERPTRTVTINGFKVSKHEVTLEQYGAFLRANPLHRGLPTNLGITLQRNHPVVGVSWDDAQDYVDWLNEVTEEKGYRLLSEAEWEYVARAGTTTLYSFGDDASSPTLSLHANCRNTACDDGYDFTAPVGSFLANPWGVHDMHGNVWEWVEDCWHGRYTANVAPTDGGAWSGGCDEANNRVARGGSWLSGDAGDLRAAKRDRSSRTIRSFEIGFRVAQSGGPEAPSPEPHPPPLPQMVEVLGGSFIMGDLAGVGMPNERPTRTVTIPDFKVSKYEVTREQYAAFVAATSYEDPGFSYGANHPVVRVSWDDAQKYVEWLRDVTGDESYRLLSEAEWEYVARAGTTTLYSFGDELTSEGEANANCARLVCADEYPNTAPVGSFAANPWGVHDMHGNAQEWVEDCWHRDYDADNDGEPDAPTDGSAWSDGCDGDDNRVFRGGSWVSDNAGLLRAASRDRDDRSVRGRFGIRVAQD